MAMRTGSAPAPDRWWSITVGGIVEGSSRGSDRVDEMTTEAMRVAHEIESQLPPADPGSELSVNVVFHMPGRFGGPTHEGAAVTRWFRKGGVIRGVVAVPESLYTEQPEGIRKFVGRTFPMAVSAAASRIGKTKAGGSLDRATWVAGAVADRLLEPGGRSTRRLPQAGGAGRSGSPDTSERIEEILREELQSLRASEER